MGRLGRTDLLKEGDKIEKAELLFEKIEDETIEYQVQKLLNTKKANEAIETTTNKSVKPIKPNVSFDDFQKIDLRIGTILACSKVPKTDKLLQFQVTDGLEERTILSGIAEFYPNPEELVGMQVCFIANFEPRKIRGIFSEGMILSAEDTDGKLVLIQPKDIVTDGSQIV